MKFSKYQLLVNKICFICGKKDCPQMKKSKDYKDFLDALEKGDVDKADKIYNTKFHSFLNLLVMKWKRI
ncbi:Uncharacterised protein [Mannheimia haemolytica]|uniref:Uncharacterized protein n=1 Tax=Mannheimia haemolytica TaxID=75985 RepID=A0A378N7I2_MANHA|nr:Uncharacterised protein [Mannheimia haemolytica]